jgi:hypothetical protein
MLLSIGLASAVFCDFSRLDKSWTYGENPTSNVLTCVSDTNDSIQLEKLGNYFTLNSTTVNQNSTKILITFDGLAPVGNYIGFINYNGTIKTTINITVLASTSGGCQLNPSLTFFSQNIQAGTRTTIPKIIFNPTGCTGTLTLSASNVYVMGGVTTNDGITKPLALSSITSDGVNLAINTEGLSSQTYQSVLYINAFTKTFTIPFNIIVTSGTSISGNFSLADLPTCSVSSNVINLNQTYSLTCVGLVPDVRVSPRIDSEYIMGTSTQTSSNQYIWFFSAKKYGDTKIYADFYYRDSPVGNPFQSDIKISSSGASIGETNIEFKFTPNLNTAKENEIVIINLLDNVSKSLVGGAEIFLNAVPLVSSDGYTFNFTLKKGVSYDLRGKAPGYDDILFTANLSSKEINLTIEPMNGTTATFYRIYSSDNISLYIDGSESANATYNGYFSKGVHEIKASGKGYEDKIINITVENSLIANHLSEFIKGEINTVILSKNVSWNVVYKEDSVDPGTSILSGTGDLVNIKPDKAGIYQILDSSGVLLDSYEIKGFDWNKKWLFMPWYVWILIIVIIIIVVIKLSSASSSNNETLPFASNINYGQN